MTALPSPSTNPRSPFANAVSDFPMTLGLIIACVLVFVIQTLMGVNPTNPADQDLLNWGANFLPLTLGSEPWRMVSSLFLHIGFLHLLFNMFALYYFGQVIERLFGSLNTLWVYLLTGIGGNVLNNFLAWQAMTSDSMQDSYMPSLSAGASGGIMGMGGLLLVAVFYKIRSGEFRLNFSALVWIMVINIGSGFIMPGIDNAGHIGGTLTGMVLGGFFVWAWRDFTKLRLAQSRVAQGNLSTTRQYSIKHFTNFYGIKVGYLVISLVFLAIYWQLHHAFVNLPAVGLTLLS